MNIEQRKIEFIKKAQDIHGQKYDYSKVEYINAGTRVIVICPKHGDFLISPTSHISPRDKCGCHQCKIENYVPSEKLEDNKRVFIEESNKIHNAKYDYSKVIYKSTNKKVIIICPIHGEFEQIPKMHRKGQGCPQCSKSYRLDTKAYIEKAILKHGNTYDYSLVNYKLSTDKIIVICRKHGEFSVVANSHLMGQGCPSCSKKKRYSLEEMIEKFKEVHGDVYDYSLVEYKNMHTKVKIICKEHGVFEQSSNNHLKKQGCPQCGLEKSAISRIREFDEILSQFKLIHGDRYRYIKDSYSKRRNKMTIICSIHGEFQQTPNSHLQGKGCLQCNVSKLEQKVINVLERKRISFIYQFRFSDDPSMTKTPYDFAIIKDNKIICVIECQGIQHYKPVKFFGGEKQLIKQQSIDKFKKDYCINKHIPIIEIPYWFLVRDIEKTLNIF